MIFVSKHLQLALASLTVTSLILVQTAFADSNVDRDWRENTEDYIFSRVLWTIQRNRNPARIHVSTKYLPLNDSDIETAAMLPNVESTTIAAWSEAGRQDDSDDSILDVRWKLWQEALENFDPIKYNWYKPNWVTPVQLSNLRLENDSAVEFSRVGQTKNQALIRYIHRDIHNSHQVIKLFRYNERYRSWHEWSNSIKRLSISPS